MHRHQTTAPGGYFCCNVPHRRLLTVYPIRIAPALLRTPLRLDNTKSAQKTGTAKSAFRPVVVQNEAILVKLFTKWCREIIHF